MTMKNAAVADVFDALADYVETLEGDHARRKTAATSEKVEKIAADYEESTGETLPDEIRAKLAATDDALLDLLVKKASTAGGSPDSLGGPAEMDTKVASEDPDEKLARWIMS
jgi:hypothetical protein